MQTVTRLGEVTKIKELRKAADFIMRRARGEVVPFEKAAVPAGTAAQTVYAEPLVPELSALRDVMVADTVLGRLLTMGAISVEPRASIPAETSEPAGGFVREGEPVPLAQMSFKRINVGDSKLALMYAITKELARLGDPRSQDLLIRLSRRALVRLEDRVALSDDAATDESPAGLLADVVGISGGSPGDLATDLALLYGTVVDGRAASPVFICSGRAAVYLAAHGGELFRTVRAVGSGSILGIPQLVSPAAGNRLILLDASEIAVSDSGLDVALSNQTTVEMSDAPSAGGAAQLVSAFQAGISVVRFVHFIDWRKLRDDAVGFLELDALNGSPS